MTASVVNDMRERMPLQASATSRAMTGSLITLPSRNTGTPIQGKVVLATRDANNCKGKVTRLKRMAGMGIISNRNAQGNKRARKKFQPRNNTIIPASTRSMEKRERNNSAPIWPSRSTPIPKPRISSPDHEGRGCSRARRERSCQTTKAENGGTKKPWEKLGSCHHCPTRWRSTGMYSQSNSPASRAVCHTGGQDGGSAASVRAGGCSACNTWLTETLYFPGDSLQHKRIGKNPAMKSGAGKCQQQ